MQSTPRKLTTHQKAVLIEVVPRQNPIPNENGDVLLAIARADSWRSTKNRSEEHEGSLGREHVRRWRTYMYGSTKSCPD
jgi:hypothetical protein